MKYGEAFFKTDNPLGEAITQNNKSDEHLARHPTEKEVSNYCGSAADHMVTKTNNYYNYE